MITKCKMFKSILLASVVTLGLALCAASQLDSDTRARAEEMGKTLLNWGPKMNSSGVDMELRKTGEGQSDGGTFVSYQLRAHGVKDHQTYSLVTWEIQDWQPKVAMNGITFDNSGRAICAGQPGTCGTQKNPNDPIELVVYARSGEPKRFALISEDGKQKAVALVVPFPIESSDRGCSLSAMLGLPDAELVVLQAKGFKANAELRVSIVSEGQSDGLTAKADSQGEYDQIILPLAKGSKTGTTKVSVVSDSCSPTLSFGWEPGSHAAK
jgi:hypothetical protein